MRACPRGRARSAGAPSSDARRCARIGEAHRQVTERHRHRDAPGAVLEPLGDVLGEPERGLRLLHAVEPELELRAREVHVELLAEPRPARRDGERARGLPQLGLGVIGAAVYRAEDRPLDREARRVEGVPRRRGARERGRQLARTVDAAGLAVRAEQAHRERGIEPRAAAQHLLGPRHEELRLVRGGQTVEQLGDRVHRDAVHPGGHGETTVGHSRRRDAPARRGRRHAPARRRRRHPPARRGRRHPPARGRRRNAPARGRRRHAPPAGGRLWRLRSPLL